MNSQENKVILIGGKHHNGLGLVRSFGRMGIKPYGIIVDEGEGVDFVKYSKYWADVKEVGDDRKALELLLRGFGKEKAKPVVIPWSDGAAEIIDKNYDILSEKYILPSIQGKQGRIAELMDKQKQIAFAQKLGLEMLPTRLVTIEELDSFAVEKPVFLKPVSSLEGSKKEMYICRDTQELSKAVEELREKKLERVLVQDYLQHRQEFVINGGVSSKHCSFTVLSNIRQWPPQRGVGSFSVTAADKSTLSYCAKVLRKLQAYGYSGPVDIEFFVSGGKRYINEINWRSGGRNFISKVSGVESAYIYYCDVTGRESDCPRVGRTRFYIMDEATDIKNIFKGNVKAVKWLSDFVRTKSYAVWDSSDIKPALKRYFRMISQFVKGDMKV